MRKGHTKKPWTTADDARMRAEFPYTRTETLAQAMGRTLNSVRSRAVFLGLQKTPDTLRTIARERAYEHNAGRFIHGKEPWNKGKAGVYHLSHGAPLGTERISDGYLQRKVRMDGPWDKRWRGVHLLTWEAHHGPVPKGYVVAFRDGDQTRVDITNLFLLSQRDNLARQSSHAHGPDIFRLHQMRGQITRAINRRVKKQ